MKRRRTITLRDETDVTCPYCQATQLFVVDPETAGEFVQDCDVCCRPWRVHVERDEFGELDVHIDRAQ